MSSLEKKIDKLESIEEIKQLVAKYAVSLDMRAIDTVSYTHLRAHET